MPNDASQSGTRPTDTELLTPAEVAELLKVHRDYVYNLLRLGASGGGLPSIVLKGSRLRRISRTDLNEWIADQPAKPDAAA